LAWIALLWVGLLLLAAWVFLMATLVGALAGVSTPALSWLECRLRAWVARFAPDPETLWLHWARHAHRTQTALWCLDRAVVLGGAEALFQQGLVILDGGYGTSGQAGAIERFRKAALRGHAEAAFHLAETLRTCCQADPAMRSEVEAWYRRSASAGFRPAAVWLAWAYETGDGVMADEDQARHWARLSEEMTPQVFMSCSLLRHDAAPTDSLVRLTGQASQGIERGWDHLLTLRSGRWLLGVAALLLGSLVFGVVGTLFWVGSAGLFHLPLLILGPSILVLGWQAWRLHREGPRRGRDRLRQAAEAGDPEACYQLGLRHRRGGPGLPKDDLDAASWFRKAAEAGHTGAMTALAEAYLGGHGVVRDPREATRWAEAARRESTS